MAKAIPDRLSVQFADMNGLMDRIRTAWVPPEYMRISEIDYAEKYALVTTETTPTLIIPFCRNPAQMVYHNLIKKIPIPRATGRRRITLKGRRMGVTTYEQMISYGMVRTQRGSQVLTVSQSKDANVDIFKMVRTMHEYDTNYMKTSMDKKDGLEYRKLKSSFTISTAKGTSIKRGSTLHRSHGTEVAFWDLNDKDAANLIASIDNATRGGEFVMESTANGPSGVFYELWQEAMSGKSVWSPIFLGWYLDPRNSVIPMPGEADEILATITPEEVFLVEKFDCNIGQLAWRRDRIKGGEKARKIFKQEYPSTAEEAFIVSGHGTFEQDVIDENLRRCQDPIYDSDGYTIWEEPITGEKYIVAADTSEGTSGSDPSPIVVLNHRTAKQVARLNWCARPSTLGHKCVEFAKKYNGALIAIENNNTGHSALNTVMNQDCYTNVFYMEDSVREDPKESLTPGWRTTGLTRPILLSDLNDSISNFEMKVNDKLFLSQCRVFRDNGSGKSEASRKSGHHGDLVIAWGIALQARKYIWSLSREVIFV